MWMTEVWSILSISKKPAETTTKWWRVRGSIGLELWRNTVETFRSSMNHLKVINKSPVEIVKEIGLAVYQFFMAKETRSEKQWHPLSICPAQGSFLLCEHIVKKNFGQFIWLLIKNIWNYFNFWLKICTILILEITMEIHTPLALHFAALFGHLNICKLIIEELNNRLKSSVQPFDVLTQAQGGLD